jgi:chaperone modulatory protein CbpM
MSDQKNKRHLEQACAETGLDRRLVVEFIRREWVLVEHPSVQETEWEVDEEDLARIRLILELRGDFGVNDESVPIILHLVDQLHALRALVTRKRK